MSDSLMSIADKILLRKKVLIETVSNELNNIAQIEHSNTVPSIISLKSFHILSVARNSYLQITTYQKNRL